MVERTADPQYRIGAVARLSGLTTHLIRIWERRYGVLTPDRSRGGARLYSESEVQRLRLLRGAVDRGHAIGQIARLDDEVLARLAHPAAIADQVVLAGQSEGEFGRDFLHAVEALDLARAKRVLLQASVTVSPRVLVVEMLGPVMARVGDAWANGKLCIASEHIASTLVRDLLGALLRGCIPDPSAETMAVTTLAGDLHELGALLSAVTAAMRGFRVAYFGPNLPADAIVQAVRRTGATILALSIVGLEPRAAAREIRALGRELPRGVKLLAGGARAADVKAELRGDLEVLATLTEFEDWLAERVGHPIAPARKRALRERGRGRRTQ